MAQRDNFRIQVRCGFAVADLREESLSRGWLPQPKHRLPNRGNSTSAFRDSWSRVSLGSPLSKRVRVIFDAAFAFVYFTCAHSAEKCQPTEPWKPRPALLVRLGRQRSYSGLL
jgi:hypothetical protein